MTVTITDSSGSNASTLVDGPAAPSATYAQGPLSREQTFGMSQQVQSDPLTRSDYPFVHPRGNCSGNYPFRAARQFTGRYAAQKWAALHKDSLKGLTRLELVESGESKKLRLHGAMQTAEAVVRGVSVEIDYVFVYGQVEEVSVS